MEAWASTARETTAASTRWGSTTTVWMRSGRPHGASPLQPGSGFRGRAARLDEESFTRVSKLLNPIKQCGYHITGHAGAPPVQLKYTVHIPGATKVGCTRARGAPRSGTDLTPLAVASAVFDPLHSRYSCARRTQLGAMRQWSGAISAAAGQAYPPDRDLVAQTCANSNRATARSRSARVGRVYRAVVSRLACPARATTRSRLSPRPRVFCRRGAGACAAWQAGRCRPPGRIAPAPPRPPGARAPLRFGRGTSAPRAGHRLAGAPPSMRSAPAAPSG